MVSVRLSSPSTSTTSNKSRVVAVLHRLPQVLIWSEVPLRRQHPAVEAPDHRDRRPLPPCSSGGRVLTGVLRCVLHVEQRADPHDPLGRLARRAGQSVLELVAGVVPTAPALIFGRKWLIVEHRYRGIGPVSHTFLQYATDERIRRISKARQVSCNLHIGECRFQASIDADEG